MISIRFPTTGVPTYPHFSALPPSSFDGALAITTDTDTLYAFNATSQTWVVLSGPTAILSIGTIDTQTPSSNGGVISSNSLYFQSASATNPGLVNNTTQIFSGNKTFTGTIGASNLSGTNTGDVTLTAVGSSPNADGASLSGQILTLEPADGSNPGLITALTQTIGGNKTFTGTIGASNLSGTNTGDVTIGTANGLSLAAQVLSLGTSSTSTTGALTSTDWNTFNGKQAAGNYITALTGDGAASGPGSVALTLATVNSNTGTFGSATNIGSFIVNGKGLITAASSISIQIAESQVNNLVSDLAGKQPTGNYITALTGDVVATGPGSVSSTIQSNVVSNSKLAQMAANTIKGNNTASTANAADLTETQVTAMLNQFTSSLQGVVPASGGGTTNFLRADGTWANAAGTVTSVGLTTPNSLSVSGSPITSSGTLALSPRSINAQTTNYTLTSTDYTVTFDTTSASVTATLPTASGISGTIYIIKKIDSTFNTVTLDTTSSQTIDGNASGALALSTQYETITLQSDGSNWMILNHRCDTSFASYTPSTSGFGTISGAVVYWRRIGDSIQVHGSFTSGTGTAAPGLIHLPSGLTGTANIATGELAGKVTTNSDLSNQDDFQLVATASATYVTLSRRLAANSNDPTSVTTNINTILPNSSGVTFQFQLPVSGWFS